MPTTLWHIYQDLIVAHFQKMDLMGRSAAGDLGRTLPFHFIEAKRMFFPFRTVRGGDRHSASAAWIQILSKFHVRLPSRSFQELWLRCRNAVVKYFIPHFLGGKYK
jgi:hypothetical protein